MKHLRILLMVVFIGASLLTCVGGDDRASTPPPTDIVITGTVAGTVSVEGEGVGGVTVLLVGATSQAATTASGGGYAFANVEAGSYGVTITNIPSGATFAATSAAVSINTQGQTERVDFSGQWLRVSSIAGRVLAGGEGVGGVSVTATGPDGISNAVTDSGGNFSFSGLRAGSYTVALSNIPEGYTYAVASNQVTLGAHEAKTVSFFGEKTSVAEPVTATVLIKSVTAVATNAPVNPANVAGQINVTVQIHPGENDLRRVSLLLDGVEVGSQALSNTVAGEGGPRRLQGGTLEVVFTVLTNAFDPVTGIPVFPNGSRVLSARLGLENAQQATVETSMSLTFNNADTFTGIVTPEKSAFSSDRALYWGGAVTATAIPVSYSGRTPISVSVSFSNEMGGTVENLTDTEAPFEFTWAATEDTDPLYRYQTPAGQFDAFTISGAVHNDGLRYEGPPVPIVGGVLIDNVAPDGAVTFTITEQAYETTTDCCDEGWLGSGYVFQTGFTGATTDDNANGVGGVTTTFHMGVGEDPKAIAALPAVSSAGEAGLAPSEGNDAYRVVAVQTDALGSSRVVELVESPGRMNPAETVGYDDLAPPEPDLSGVADMSIFGFGDAALAGLTVDVSPDDRSGYSLSPLQGYMQYKAPETGSGYLVGYSAGGGAINFFQAAFQGVCAADPVGGLNTAFQYCVPDEVGGASDGYYTLLFALQDKAGNRTGPYTRRIFVDGTPPMVWSAWAPLSFVGGEETTFEARVTDNLEVGNTWFGVNFGGAPATPGIYIPLSPPTSQADGDWDATLTKVDTASVSFLFVRSVDGAPATDFQTIHTDYAGNASAPVATEFVTGAVQAPGAGPGGIWEIINPDLPVTLCNGNPAAAATCGGLATDAESVTVTVEAKGATGTFANPVAGGKVYLYLVSDADALPYSAAPEGWVLLSVLDGNGATVTDDNVNRFYHWSYTLTSADVSDWPLAASARLVALVVDADGDGILTAYNPNVTVRDAAF